MYIVLYGEQIRCLCIVALVDERVYGNICNFSFAMTLQSATLSFSHFAG
jgi:hypothetical protein